MENSSLRGTRSAAEFGSDYIVEVLRALGIVPIVVLGGTGPLIRCAVDFASLARAYALHGEGPIERMQDLKPALKRALRAVKDEGKTALVDVVCEPR